MRKVVKTFLIIFSLAIVILGVIDRYVWSYTVDIKRDSFDQKQFSLQESDKAVVQEYFGNKVRIVQGLHLTIEDVISRQGGKDTLVITELLSSYTRSDGTLDQLRLLDKDGHEEIRFENRKMRGWVKIEKAGLQDKSDRPYFKELLGSSPDAFYFGNIGLNQENDTIEHPYKPVIRLSFPIYNEHREFSGVLVANYRVEDILSQLAEKTLKRTHTRYIINEEGYFISSGADVAPFGNLIGENADAHISKVLPDAYSSWNSDVRDTVVHGSAFHYYISKIHLPEELLRTDLETISKPREWTLISRIPESVITAQIKDHMGWWRIVEIVVLIIVILSSFYIAYQRGQLESEKRQLTMKVAAQTAELNESKLRFESIFNNTFQFVGLLTPDGTLVEANNTALEFGGFTKEQATGQKFWDAPWWSYDPKLQEELILAINKAASGEFVRYDALVQGKDRKATIDFSLRPVKDENGEIVYLIPEGRDISEKKELEEKLEYEKSLFLETFENSPIGATLVSPQGDFVQVNTSLCNMLGYTSKDLMRTNFQNLTHPEDLESDLKLLYEVIDGKRNGYRMEKRYIRKDGEIIFAELHVSCIRDANGKVESFISQIVDKTQAKLHEDQIEYEFELRSSILDSSPSAIMTLRAIRDDGKQIVDFEWTLVNETAEDSIKKSSGELIGARLLEILPQYRKNGLFDRFVRVVESGLTDDVKQPINEKGDQPTWLHLRIVKHYDGVIVAYEDITSEEMAESKQRELIQQLQIRNNQLHDFNFMLSHNLRSPFSNVGVLLGFIEESDDAAERQMIIDRMRGVISKVEDVMENLTDAVKMQSSLDAKAEPIELRTLIEKVEAFLKENLQEVDGMVEIDTSAWNMITYPRATLESILLNLLSNAIKYRSFDRPLQVKFETIMENEARILKVSDNGSGIDMDRYGQHIFKLNKTFHRDRPGKGLGLYMTRYQIQALGGDIYVESEVEKGTTFTIEF